MAGYEVVLTEECWRKFAAYTDICNTEVAAFGYIKPQDEGYMLVDELFLVPQEVSGTEVDFITEGLPFAIQKAIEDDRLDDLRFCIHSHVNMGVQFSTTDEDMIEKMGKYGSTPWFVSAIFNKKGETNCRLDLFDTGIPGLSHIRSITLDITSEEYRELDDECIAEIDKFVKKQTKQTHHMNSGHKPLTPREIRDDKKFNGPQKFAKDKDGDWKSKSEATDDKIKGAARELVKRSNNSAYGIMSIEESLELHLRAEEEGWDSTMDNQGVEYFFDKDGNYMGDAISLESLGWGDWT